MSTQLNQNTTSLQAILNAVNALPESGGGGLPSGISALACGTFTPTEDISSNQTIEHGLGVTPNFFAWWVEEDVSTTPVANLNITGVLLGKNAKYNSSSTIVYTVYYFIRGYTSTPQISGSSSNVANTAYMNNTSCYMVCSSTYKLLAGYTYHWVAGVIDGIS